MQFNNQGIEGFDVKTKICTSCGVEQSLDDYYSRKDRPSRRSQCKLCDKKRAKKWYSKTENKDKSIKRVLNWKKKNPEKNLFLSLAYQRKHPEKVRINNHNHEALKKSNGGKIIYSDWVKLKNKYGNICLKCKKKDGEVKLTMDHVIPLKLGGLNVIENIQPLCFSCNASKGAKEIDYR